MLLLIGTVLPVTPAAGQGELGLSYVSDTGIDINGDDVYEYLEIKVEADIPSSGNYILECTNFVDSEGNVIPLATSQQLNLEAGEHEITIRFDGRRIYSTESVLVNVSRLDLIKSDYAVGDFLNDLPLSRSYEYSEFISPEDYDIGVAPGDWMRYQVTSEWESNDPSWQPAANPLKAISLSVENVEDKLISLNANYSYERGSQSDERMEGYLDKAGTIFPFLAPANLEQEESFGQIEVATINETGKMNVLGHERDFNLYISEQRFQQGTREVTFKQKHYWDKETGILIQGWFNLTSTDNTKNYKTTNNVSLTLNLTNLIPQKTNIKITVPEKITTDKKVNITARLTNYEDKGIPGQTIHFISEGNELGTAQTNNTGHTIIEYTSNTPRTAKIEASYNGTEGYQESASTLTLEIEREKTGGINKTLLIIAIAIIAILAIAASVLLSKINII